MKPLGIILIIIGAIWGLIAWNMGTTVTTDRQSIGNVYIPSQTVNNIGLMEERRNHLMGAGLTLLVGVILFAAGGRSTQTNQDASYDNSRKCPFCAELIKSEAILCKHCGKDLPAVEQNKITKIIDDNPKLICWTCSKYSTGTWDQSTGKCLIHSKKTNASDTCEQHSPKVQNA